METRPAVTHKFNVGGTKGYVNVGLNPDGQPMEIFITISKNGSTLGGFADALARLASISLQHGIPLELICRKMQGLSFAPQGTTINPEIPIATSIVDYVFHWIERSFIQEKKA